MLEKQLCKTISIMTIIQTTKGVYFLHMILFMTYEFPKLKLDSTLGLENNNVKCSDNLCSSYWQVLPGDGGVDKLEMREGI